MKRVQYYLGGLLMVMLPLLSGCNSLWEQDEVALISNDTPPQVTISYPPPGEAVGVNQVVQIQSTSVDPEGIAQVELLINNEPVRRNRNTEPQPGVPFIVAQPWTPVEPGFFAVVVRAVDADGVAGQSNPLTLEVVDTTPRMTATPPPEPQTASGEATSTPEPPTLTPTPSPRPTLPNTPTPAPRVEPTLPTPRPTPTDTPIVLQLPSPTTTPTIGNFNPTGIEPEGRFRDIWEVLNGGKGRLGYPLEPALGNQNFAKQRFHRGEMFWWDNTDGPDYIWVIDAYAGNIMSGTSSNLYTDTWEADEVNEFNCNEALENGDVGPIRGFGKLWCDRLELQVRLGDPLEKEIGSGGFPPYSDIQFFQGGVMIYNPINKEVLVLYSQGDWQRFIF